MNLCYSQQNGHNMFTSWDCSWLYMDIFWCVIVSVDREDLQESRQLDKIHEIHCAFSYVCVSHLFGECFLKTIINYYALVQESDMWSLLQWTRSPGKEGSHFNPYSNLFTPSERKEVAISTLCWVIMLSLLLYLSSTTSPLLMLKVYGVPYMVKLITPTLLKTYQLDVLSPESILELKSYPHP